MLLVQILPGNILMAQDTSQEGSKLMSSVYNEAQHESEKSVPLVNLLQRLEHNFNVTFLYEQNLIAGKTVSEDEMNLQKDPGQRLSLVLNELGFTYNQIDEETYVILKKRGNLQPVMVQEVTGRVVDMDTGETLPGVNIRVEGTNIGTTTDMNGEYELTNIPDDENLLVFSFVGYQEKVVQIDGRSQINVELEQAVATLEDVVVIGYGERERKDLTGAISTVDSEGIEQTITVSPEMALQGRTAGVNVTSGGGNPNARPEITIRGVGTFGISRPLYVIDGVPITEYGSGAEQSSGRATDLRGTVNIFTLVDPDDIESISVLKDASAAAIYGVRAANGVVLIQTKDGEPGDVRVSVNLKRGVQNITDRYDMLNTTQYTNLYQEAYANNPDLANTLPNVFRQDSAAYLGNSTTYNWQDALINDNAITEDYNIRVSGGNENTTYYISGGFANTESPLKGNSLERYSFSGNLKSEVSDLVDVGVNFRFGYVNSLTNTASSLQAASTYSPWQPIFAENRNGLFGMPYAAAVDSAGSTLWGPETETNFLAVQDVNRRDYQLTRNIGSGYVQVEPLNGLLLKSTVNADWYYNRRNDFEDIRFDRFNPFNSPDALPGSVGSYGERHARNYNVSVEFSANYQQDFGSHSVDLLGNAMFQRYGFELISANTRMITTRDPDRRYIQEVADPEATRGFNDLNADGLRGYMARLSYNYESTYYVDATVRRDGTSRFAEDFRWGTFPSFALAWRISNESFMQDIDFLSDLKLRGGWGKLGNQETQRFAYLSTVGVEPTYALGSGSGNGAGTVNGGIRLPDFPTRDLSWETVTTTSFGFDAMFFSDAITLTAEYYQRDTEGILQSVDIAPSVGNEVSPVFNIAEVRNSGIEVQLGFNGRAGDLQYNISGNVSTVKNEVLDLADGQPFGGGTGRIEEGYPLFYIWGYKTDGIFQSEEEINTWSNTYEEPGSTKSPGDIRYQDVHGPPPEDAENVYYSTRPDSVINNFDRTYLGKTIPGYNYGISFSGSYKNFDLSILFQGVGDVQKYNFDRASGESMASTGINQWTTTLNRWTEENPSTSMPRAVRGDPGNNNRFSDRFVEDAGYLRLKNFQLGYTLPVNLMNSLGAPNSSFRLFVSGSNIFTVTNYTGLDPEIGTNGVPLPRTFMLGLDATFN
jgi:TonB-linked SusC/RagA family outer membrane protein